MGVAKGVDVEFDIDVVASGIQNSQVYYRPVMN